MPLKNHYETLHLPSNASHDDIKKAFRKLALQFHPDKSNNASSHRIFLEIQESYAILSDPKKKRLYDEERYFSGLTSRKEPTSISSDWILKLSIELRKHTTYLHSYDINHNALYQYTMLILSDVHLAFLQTENDIGKNREIIDELLTAFSKIDYSYYEKLAARLLTVKPLDTSTRQVIEKEWQARKRKNQIDKQLPWLVLLTILALCIFMFFYARIQS